MVRGASSLLRAAWCVQAGMIGCFVLMLGPTAFAQTTGVSRPVSTTLRSDDEMQRSLAQAQQLVRDGAWLQAKEEYVRLLAHVFEPDRKRAIEQVIEDLNLKLLFSPIQTGDSIEYEVVSGDSLYKIAKKYNTTIELIQKANGLSSDVIRPGMKLKVSTAHYTILVDKGSNELVLFANGKKLKQFPVATGLGDKTPIGTFKIQTKLEHPIWYTEGAVYPADSPDNILGTRWLGFDLKGYGIHGTTKPETIGTRVTKGCVRMYNKDVETLYTIVPRGTEVRIIE